MRSALLTGEEVEKYLPEKNDRRAKPSERAKEKGALIGNGEHAGFTAWWTMPKCNPTYCQFVTPDGSMNYHGRNAYHKDVTFRPSVWIDLKKYAEFYEKKAAEEPKPSGSANTNEPDITRYYQQGGGGIFKINRKNRSCYILNQKEQKWIPSHSELIEFEWGSFGATEIHKMDIAAIQEIKADPKEEKMVDMTIGRDPGCNICLENPSVSRIHASLHYLGGKKGRWLIQDRNSRNCTFVNGVQVTKTELKKNVEGNFGSGPAKKEKKPIFGLFSGWCRRRRIRLSGGIYE